MVVTELLAAAETLTRLRPFVNLFALVCLYKIIGYFLEWQNYIINEIILLILYYLYYINN